MCIRAICLHLGTILNSLMRIIRSEFASRWDKVFSTRAGSVEPAVAITLGIGNSITAVELLAADTIRSWAMKVVLDLYKTHDLTIIATPTLPMLPPELREAAKMNGESDTGLTVEVMKYIFLANFLGMPGYSIPVGFGIHEKTGESLPIGFHMLGRHWGEAELFRVANAIEQMRDFSKQYPKDGIMMPKYFIDSLS